MLFSGITLLGCTSRDPLAESPSLPREEVSITAVQSSFNGNSTRATNSGFEPGDAIGIFAVLHPEGKLKPSGNIAHNKKWILKEVNGIKEWQPATDNDKIYYRNSDEKLDFYAYYPYSETITNPLDMQLTVNADQSAGISSSDFMASKNTRGLWRGPVSFQFSHQLSRMELTVIRVLGSASATDHLTAMINVPVSGYRFNLQTQAVTSGTASETTQTMTFQYITQNDGDNVNREIKYLYHLILPPQEISPSKDCFQFKLDGRDYKSKTANTLTLVPGKRTAHEIVLNFSPIIPNN